MTFSHNARPLPDFLWVVYGYFLGDEVFIGTLSMHTLQEDHHSQ